MVGAVGLPPASTQKRCDASDKLALFQRAASHLHHVSDSVSRGYRKPRSHRHRRWWRTTTKCTSKTNPNVVSFPAGVVSTHGIRC